MELSNKNRSYIYTEIARFIDIEKERRERSGEAQSNLKHFNILKESLSDMRDKALLSSDIEKQCDILNADYKIKSWLILRYLRVLLLDMPTDKHFDCVENIREYHKERMNYFYTLMGRETFEDIDHDTGQEVYDTREKIQFHLDCLKELE